MKCPTCERQLIRDKYEHLVVHRCSICKGYLLDIERLKVIQARMEKNEEQLHKEIEAAATAKDTLERIRCPSCREKMEKRPAHFGETKFFVDECHRCNLVWLDAGELAKLQAKFETGERGLEQQKMIARRESMSPEERKEYEDRIDHLPEFTVFKHLFGSTTGHPEGDTDE